VPSPKYDADMGLPVPISLYNNVFGRNRKREDDGRTPFKCLWASSLYGIFYTKGT